MLSLGPKRWWAEDRQEGEVGSKSLGEEHSFWNQAG